MISVSTQLFSQTNEELKDQMLQNEDFFLSIVSQYYPLSPEKIERFEDQLIFYNISKNSSIDWTESLIEQYLPLLIKPNLMINKGVDWNQEMILKYKDQDWFGYRGVCLNREVSISKELFEIEKDKIEDGQIEIKSKSSDQVVLYFPFTIKQGYKLLHHFIRIPNEMRNNLYEHPLEFEKLMQTEIEKIDFNVLVQNSAVIDWEKYFTNAKVEWDWDKLSKIDQYIKCHMMEDNEEAINDLILSKLSEQDIEEILLKIEENNQDRLYEVSDRRLGEGYSPNVTFKGLRNDDFFMINQSDDYFPETLKNSSIEIPFEYGLPEAYFDYHEFSSWTKVPVKVISPKLKSILENFNLPEHRFYPIKLTMDSRDWGGDSRDYFVFVCDTVQHAQIEINKTLHVKTGFMSHDTFVLTKPKYIQFNERRIELMPNTYPKYKDYNWKEIHLDTDYDLASLHGAGIWISERLAECMMENDITGFSINRRNNRKLYNKGQSNSKLECKIDFVEEHKTRTSMPIMRRQSIKDSIKLLIANAPKDYVEKFYKTKKKRTEAEQTIINKELEFDVIFPEFYKEYLLNPENFKISSRYNDFEFSTIENLNFNFPDDWGDNPFTAKGVEIGGDGYNVFALFLEQANPHHLSNDVYFFDEEVYEFRNIGPLDKLFIRLK